MPQPPLATSLVVDGVDQLAYASAWVRAYCGWHITPSLSETTILDTNGGTVLVLPTLHMTGLGAVVYSDTVSTAVPPVATVVPPVNLTWSEKGLVSLNNFGSWPAGLRTVTVSYTHGYAEVPDAVRAVTVAVAKRIPALMDSVTAGAVGGVSWQYGGMLAGQAALSSSFTAVEAMVLDRYRVRASP